MPALTERKALDLLAGARVARLGTVCPDGSPHLVPVTFALAAPGAGPGAGVLYFAIDAKPKSTSRLRRLANIRHDQRVTVLADHYSEDWAKLWWVRADGIAAEVAGGTDEQAAALRLLTGRYQQYRDQPPAGPVVAIRILRLTGWTAGPPSG